MANILIVDDSIVMRKNLATILRADGHTIVGEASNGRQAISQYEELKPDVVTMDISMPIMSGVEAVEKIIELFPEAKIIMISAVNQKKMVFNAINSGAKHYIIKPIDIKKVLSVVNEVLINDSAEDVVTTVEKVNSKQGFDIANMDGKFIINFNEALDQSDHNLLSMAIRGILFIKPLKVEFNFEKVLDVSEKILIPITSLAEEIVAHGGDINYVVKSEAIRAKLSEQ